MEALDLDQPLQDVMDFEKERHSKEAEYENQINKLGFELQSTRTRLADCKKILTQKNDQISLINKTQNNYELLNQDYASVCQQIADKRGQNKEMEKDFLNLAQKFNSDKKRKTQKNGEFIALCSFFLPLFLFLFCFLEIMNRIVSIQANINELLLKNTNLFNGVRVADKQLETALETQKKGSSAEIELNKLKKWNASKETNIGQLETQLTELENEIKSGQANIKSLEKQLTSIEDRQAIKLQKIIKKKEEVLTGIYAKNHILKGYKQIFQSIRGSEIRCLEKRDFVKEKLELQKKRMKALKVLEGAREMDLGHLDEKIEGTRKMYERKIDFFSDENKVLETDIEFLEQHIEEIKQQKEIPSDVSESFRVDTISVMYSDINSDIESLSFR